MSKSWPFALPVTEGKPPAQSRPVWWIGLGLLLVLLVLILLVLTIGLLANR